MAQGIHRRLQEKLESLKERRKFLEKQAEDIRKERNDAIDEMNAELVAYFRQANLLEGLAIDPKAHHFHFDSGAIVLCDEETVGGSSIEAIIGNLFGGRPPS